MGAPVTDAVSVSTRTAAEELGLTTQRIVQLIRDGKIVATREPGATHGRPWQVSRADLDRFKAERAAGKRS